MQALSKTFMRKTVTLLLNMAQHSGVKYLMNHYENSVFLLSDFHLCVLLNRPSTLQIILTWIHLFHLIYEAKSKIVSIFHLLCQSLSNSPDPNISEFIDIDSDPELDSWISSITGVVSNRCIANKLHNERNPFIIIPLLFSSITSYT